MTFAELKNGVQTLFPIKFSESLIYSEEPTDIDKTINIAIKRAMVKYEKVEGREITGSQLFDRAASIVKCVPSANQMNVDAVSVWNSMDIPVGYMGNVKHYFGPDKYLRLWPDDATVWLEYVVHSSKLTVEDLDETYCDWATEYAVALLKIKEGYIGTSAVLTTLPFQFNYEKMLSDGTEDKKTLEDRMNNDMFSGTLAIRVN